MAAPIYRYPKNVPGKYYVNADCTDCDLCRETAPNNFRRDDEEGISYVYKQPTTTEEIALCEESREGCPEGSVRSDGEQFDWRSAPIVDWSRCSEHLRPDLDGLNVLSPEEEAQMPRHWRWPRPNPPAA